MSPNPSAPVPNPAPHAPLAPQAAAKFRRKQYLVVRATQLRFARFVIAFAFGTALITGLTVFYTTFLMLGERLSTVYPQGRLVALFRSVHVALFIDLVLMLPVIFWGSIVFSHRFAGPLPKIYATLRRIGAGDFDTHLMLRKNDELGELTDAINEMAQNLREREKKK